MEPWLLENQGYHPCGHLYKAAVSLPVPGQQSAEGRGVSWLLGPTFLFTLRNPHLGHISLSRPRFRSTLLVAKGY